MKGCEKIKKAQHPNQDCVFSTAFKKRFKAV